ncbi:MAG: diacylglycerol kinase [Alphaproteobacteria bacterium]|nr:MAG: diacylglycerol kinase [Alphaproteobacteria bacterium]
MTEWTPEAAVARRRIAIVVNAHSRRGQVLFEAACAGLQARGFEIVASHAVKKPKQLGAIIGKLVADGHDLIAVGGGDGTLAGAAGKLARKNVVMAILPLGTANSFARTLGIEPELEPALDVIAGGDVAQADVVRIGDGFFINSATIGVPARIAQDIPSGLKRWLGRAGYLGYGCYKFLTMQPFVAKISIAGQPDITEQVVEIRIGNGAFVGGLRVIDGADPESRDIVIHLVLGRYAAALAGVWAANLAGWRPAGTRVREIRSTAFDLSCTPQQPISVDGETGTKTPVHVSIDSAALHVITPRGSDAESRTEC